jgi:predicted AlkP superfamily phosphohydrolase/phosphomutase
MTSELLSNVGNFYIDCARMPSQKEIEGNEAKVVNSWLEKVQLIREQQTKLFDYLLTRHPTDFTFLAQSCEDRVGHWLYPIQPFNVGYDGNLARVSVDAFPNQYRALDKVIGKLLEHVDNNTYFFILSDHGIKPLRYQESPHAHADHAGTTPVIAKHDYLDGDEVPGALVAMGPGIKQNEQLLGLDISVLDIAPTILSIYGIEKPSQMRGRVIRELFVNPMLKPVESPVGDSSGAR